MRRAGWALTIALAWILGLASGMNRGVSAPIHFTDVTEGSGLQWSTDQPIIRTGVGLAVLFWDDDLLPDLVVAGGDPGVLALYQNLGALTFSPVPEEISGLGPVEGEIRGLSAADFDGDGDTDLLVGRWATLTELGEVLGQPTLLLRNEGGAFTDASEALGAPVPGPVTHAAWTDFDGDGLLDVFLSRYYWQPNRLLRGLPGGGFEDVTVGAGVDTLEAPPVPGFDGGMSLEGLWWDVNRDGLPDLYLMNDRCYLGYPPNRLYLNDGDGTFTEDASGWNLDLCMDAMAGTPGDVNGDGHLDLLITNSYYGHVLMQGGCDAYGDVSLDAGIVSFQWGWCGLMEDFDQDGWIDIYICHEAGQDPTILEELGDPSSANRIFQNLMDGTFESLVGGYAGPEGESFMAVTSDLDLDGDLDIVLGDLGLDSRFKILANDGDHGHWLQIELRATAGHPEALGATAHLLSSGRWQQRLHRGGAVLSARSEPILHFGLGDAAVVDELRIRWPSGAHQILYDVAADQRLVITEPAVGDSEPSTLLTERCGDGEDNDCDGETDEGFEDLGTVCEEGVGACESAGVLICASSGDALTCDATPLPPFEEACNGLDDDCDGETDEGCEDVADGDTLDLVDGDTPSPSDLGPGADDPDTPEARPLEDASADPPADASGAGGCMVSSPVSGPTALLLMTWFLSARRRCRIG